MYSYFMSHCSGSCRHIPGDFWLTNERLILAPMTTSIGRDSFSLIVEAKSKSTGFWEVRIVKEWNKFSHDLCRILNRDDV